MNEIQLLELLEKIYSLSFLESILEIQKQELVYKKSDFFKQTKIPLNVLYEKFFIYNNTRYGFDEKMNEFITNIDIEKLTNLTLEWIQKLNEDEKVMNLLKKVFERFNVSELEEIKEEINGIISNVTPNN